MISELAGELIARGHEVTVFHLNWNEKPGRETRELTGSHEERIVDVVPRAVGKPGSLLYKISKFLLSNLHAVREMRAHLAGVDFDASVSWTPALTVALPLLAAIKRGVPAHILFVFDFFPIHQMEIGLMPRGPVYWVSKWLEDRMYRKFTAIICNFPGNIEYLKRHYPIREDTNVISTPLWSDISPPEIMPRAEVRRKYGLPADRPIAIFGGQITEGRGIEQMLGAAEYASQNRSPLLYLFVGDGRLVPLVSQNADALDNVRHIASVDRSEYLSLVGACDIGMVATVEGVSSFSFPTKTIDYLRVGLKIVASVEEGSDYLTLLSEYRLGNGVNFNDPEGYYRAADELARNLDDSDNDNVMARKCLEEVFHVAHAANSVLKVAEKPK